MEELLRLTRENNEMLKEIVGYIRKVESADYQNMSDFRAFLINLGADLLVDGGQRGTNNNLQHYGGKV